MRGTPALSGAMGAAGRQNHRQRRVQKCARCVSSSAPEGRYIDQRRQKKPSTKINGRGYLVFCGITWKAKMHPVAIETDRHCAKAWPSRRPCPVLCPCLSVAISTGVPDKLLEYGVGRKCSSTDDETPRRISASNTYANALEDLIPQYQGPSVVFGRAAHPSGPFPLAPAYSHALQDRP